MLSATIWKEGRAYVSKCPELGVSSFGRTPDVALEVLREAVSLYLSNARKLGMLFQALGVPFEFRLKDSHLKTKCGGFCMNTMATPNHKCQLMLERFLGKR